MKWSDRYFIIICILAFILPGYLSMASDRYFLKCDENSIATGITICFKNKKYLEKNHDLPGASDLVAHLFQIKYREMEDDFRRLGADLQFYDYPFIPFDDYYTNDYFGFIRVKVLPQNTDEALNLVFSLIKRVENFTDEDLKIAKKSVYNSNIMRNRKKEKIKKNVFKAYFGDSFFAMPDYCFNTGFDLNNFKGFVKEYLDPSNIFISMYGKFDPLNVSTILDSYFRGSKPVPIVLRGRLRNLKNHKILLEGEGKQAYVYIFYPLKDIKTFSSLAKLYLLTSYVSEKVSFQIREREGLAYSVGCYLMFKGGHLFFVSYCATAPSEVSHVAGEMKSIVDAYMLKPVKLSSEDMKRIKGRVLLSNMLKTLPNVNKSFFNAMYRLTEFKGYNKIALDKEIKKAKIEKLCGTDFLVYNNFLEIILK